MSVIPRYTPTYSWNDIFHAYAISNSNIITDLLVKELKKIYKVNHIFLFSHAREALASYLKAYNQPGEVLIPAYNCIVVPEAIISTGYTPIFVDIDDKSVNASAENFKSLITPSTSAIVATHQFGLPCELDKFIEITKNTNIKLIEDAAPAVGVKYNHRLVGSMGDASILSFDQRKIISGIGGGALLTNDDFIASKIEERYLHGENKKKVFYFLKAVFWKLLTLRGPFWILKNIYNLIEIQNLNTVVEYRKNFNSNYIRPISSFQAALVLVQLSKFQSVIKRRKEISNIYHNNLCNLPEIELIKIQDHSCPSWLQFPVGVPNKYEFYKFMASKHIDLSWTFKYSCSDSFGQNNFPNTKKFVNHFLGLPTYPALLNLEVLRICDAIKVFFNLRKIT
jgi:dTDP-4-amino-4,6-dideoxygalactose transaminase